MNNRLFFHHKFTQRLEGLASADIQHKAMEKQRKLLRTVGFLLRLQSPSCQLVVMVVVFVLCWTPYASTAVAGILGQARV